MSKTALYASVIQRVDFYLAQYRALSVAMCLLALIFLVFSSFVIRIAIKPHAVPSIITTTDGRLIRPASIYFARGKGTYFWRIMHADKRR